MKQILQDLSSGATLVADVPAPFVRARHLLVSTAVSLVSSGTERMLTDFAKGSLASKAMQQPHRVKEALQKVRTDGLAPTVDAIRSKLDQPMSLGYCNVGRVLEVGEGAEGFTVGDRILSNGKHAEVVVVPWTLSARIPDEVDDESASFAVLGAIALEGIRLAAPTIGETFVVTGLGIIGLLAVQILRANGCRVLGIDTSPDRIALAQGFGAETVDLSKGEDPISKATAFSRGRGVDGVLLTLDSKSDEPLSQAAKICRKRGRIVLVGVTGLNINRADFYEKELTFQVSCSYGPGRYDPRYEEQGLDYPYGHVRWTEQRNFEAVLDLMASGAVDPKPLLSHRFDVNEAPAAYNLLTSKEKVMGILLRYPDNGPARLARSIPLAKAARVSTPSRGTVGFIGAGNYGGRVLIDAFGKAGATLHTLTSATGVSAAHYGEKLDFEHISTDSDALIADPNIDTICISTRHDSHARFVLAGLVAGKHVFVEKPLCLTLDQLKEIDGALAASPSSSARTGLLMVGFNRRFAPLIVEAKSRLSSVSEPKVLVMTVNAGAIPPDHWTQNPAVGGGRIVGEGCHFIDLLRHLVGHPIIGFDVVTLKIPGGPLLADTATIMLRFADGSHGVINYLANGSKEFPKERLEVFCAGRVLVMDNYRSLTGYGWPGFSKERAWKADKGQKACVAAFVAAVKSGGPAPIPSEELIEVSRVSIEAAALC